VKSPKEGDEKGWVVGEKEMPCKYMAKKREGWTEHDDVTQGWFTGRVNPEGIDEKDNNNGPRHSSHWARLLCREVNYRGDHP